MKVLKFGGTSVKDTTNIKKVLEILKSQYEGKDKYAVVVSAFGGITDLLIDMSEKASTGNDGYLTQLDTFKKRASTVSQGLLSDQRLEQVQKLLEANHKTLENLLHGIMLVREASPRTMDYVLSFGERTSALIIAAACNEIGIPANFLDARNIIKTNKEFGSAQVNHQLTQEKISEYFDKSDRLEIVTGFIASDVGGLTTTLGRGGSDYTASILASCLDATVLDIWTDVDGVLTSDPRKVKKAFTVNQLSYSEAMELSHFGAKVIYPPTILPALSKNIPIYIKNTFNPTFAGTKISQTAAAEGSSQITGVSAMKDVSLLRLQGGGMFGIPGISGRLFSAFARNKIIVVFITQASSEYSISFAVKTEDIETALATLNEEFEKEIDRGEIQEILVEKNLSIVAVVSEKMRNKPGVAGKLFSALGKEGINIVAISQGSSELNISFVINSVDEEKALNLIHDAFFLSEASTVNVFSIGVGLIGGTLFQQINDARESVYNEQRLDLQVIGIANSKKMVFEDAGIDLDAWKDTLEKSDLKSDTKSFVEKMVALNLPNTVFVDNTANKDIAEYYNQILSSNISIVTPNKVASSSSYQNYLALKKIAKSKGVHFFYETNVGAGLPIITTISKMISSGDKIHRLEAVLSGSISFIFNTFDGSIPFSDIVLQAKAKGYTEPDPRDDLSGLDVMRKITILARETGLPTEIDSVALSPILNKACLNAKDIDAFFTELKSMDAEFAKMNSDASQKGEKLRFIAKLIDGECSVGIESVGENSPFYNLGGSDNMVVIYSERYKTRPLVIKGPGAGADVTAAGVFSEILEIGSSIANR